MKFFQWRLVVSEAFREENDSEETLGKGKYEWGH